MEGFRSPATAFSAHHSHHYRLHVLRRRVYVGRRRDDRNVGMDKRRCHDGRLRVHDRPYNGIPVAIQNSVPLPHTRTASVLGRPVHRVRLHLYGVRLPTTRRATLLCQRLLQDCRNIRMLEQHSAQDNTQKRFCRVLPVPLHICSRQRATRQHSHRL